MAKATPQQLDERRVKREYKRYRDVRAKLNAHVEANKEAFEEAYELSEAVNIARKRLDKVCRETGIGIGPISVSRAFRPQYDVDYIETLFKDSPEILQDLVVVKKSIQRKVFERMVQGGELTTAQAKKAVLDTSVSVRLSGVPDEIVLP